MFKQMLKLTKAEREHQKRFFESRPDLLAKLSKKDRDYFRRCLEDPEKVEREYNQAMKELVKFEAWIRKDPERSKQLDKMVARSQANKRKRK